MENNKPPSLSSPLLRVELLSRKAMACNKCFDEGWVDRPEINNIAQPRWIGPRYWESSHRIIILMVNPGQGKEDERAEKATALLHSFGDGGASLEDIFTYQEKAMKRWGKGRFLHYYCDNLGCNLEELAFANIAWCATKKNSYPKNMLDLCFENHTKPLLTILKPDIILAAGNNAFRLSEKIKAILPAIRVIRLLHHAHRKGKAEEERQFGRARRELAFL